MENLDLVGTTKGIGGGYVIQPSDIGTNLFWWSLDSAVIYFPDPNSNPEFDGCYLRIISNPIAGFAKMAGVKRADGSRVIVNSQNGAFTSGVRGIIYATCAFGEWYLSGALCNMADPQPLCATNLLEVKDMISSTPGAVSVQFMPVVNDFNTEDIVPTYTLCGSLQSGPQKGQYFIKPITNITQDPVTKVMSGVAELPLGENRVALRASFFRRPYTINSKESNHLMITVV